MTNRRRLFFQYGLLVSAVVLVGLGVLRQEHVDVLQKAVRVCLECIGIG